ncbi:MAG TPA: L,D-transpeptidase family protein [Pseudolabrys sp.]|nr:L,D-transpeptidase family protein [Pseudolabrys sp.]
MIRRSAALLAVLLCGAAVLSAGPISAQYYPTDGSSRAAPPPGYRWGPPPSGFWDDDGDAPVVRSPYPGSSRSAQAQGAQNGPARILPYPPEEADAGPPPPGVAPAYRGPSADYGHQLDPMAPRPGVAVDPDVVRPPAGIGASKPAPAPANLSALPPEDQPEVGEPKELPPQFKRQLVDYVTKEPAGTIIIDTPNTYLYLVLGNGKALRYGIGVGREGFTWSGAERISKMAEWPDWHPPAEMIERQPYLPRFMAGGEGNPLGARALYLGKTLYRIHGTNQPSTIGSFVSSGCIRLTNQDIEDLYSRVQVGSRVVVLPGSAPATASAAPVPGPQVNGPMPGASYPANTSRTGISSNPLPPPPHR